MYTITAYIVYLFLSIITVFVVGKILHTNGKSYLFGECPDKELAYSANNFLYLGYCLINTAFALFFLRSTSALQSFAQVLEFITASQGFIFLSLGLMHFVNVIFAPKILMFFLSKKLLTPSAEEVDHKNQKS